MDHSRALSLKRILRISAVLMGGTVALAVPLYAKSAEKIKAYYQNAERYFDKNEYKKALEELEKALAISPDIPQIYNMLGIVYLKQGESLDSAIGSFQEAIRLDPHYADPYYNLAVTYVGSLHEPNRAAEYFAKVIELDPDYGKAYLGLGWITLYEKKEPEDAIALFQSAIDKTPEDLPEAHFGLGVAYLTLGKRDRVLKPISVLRAMNRNDLALTLEKMMQPTNGASEEQQPVEIPPSQR